MIASYAMVGERTLIERAGGEEKREKKWRKKRKSTEEGVAKKGVEMTPVDTKMEETWRRKKTRRGGKWRGSP